MNTAITTIKVSASSATTTTVAATFACCVLSATMVLGGYIAIRQAKRHGSVDLAIVGTLIFLVGVASLWCSVRLCLSALSQFMVL